MQVHSNDDDYEFCRSHFEAMAVKRLTPFERACLLCSLFLGYSFWTFVAIGTRKSNEETTPEDHAWVVTLSRDENGSVDSFYLWEPTTGENCQQGQYASTDGFFFENVYLLFNDKELYANINEDPKVSRSSWDVENTRYWKSVRCLQYDLPNMGCSITPHCADGSTISDRL